MPNFSNLILLRFFLLTSLLLAGCSTYSSPASYSNTESGTISRESAEATTTSIEEKSE
jgi:hypothetical protein